MKNVYIITGTTRGLGKALLAELVKEENLVFSISRSLTKDFEANPYVRFVHCDLQHTESLSTIIEKIFSQIDLVNTHSITLINNAGVLKPIKSVQNAIVEEIKNGIDVNLTALIAMTSLFLKKVQTFKIKKIIVNISSGAGENAYDGWSVYCSTKAGVDMFTRCVALEQKRQEFPATIFSFYPGIIDTSMQKLIRESDKEDFPRVEDFIEYKNSRELLSPEFVAKKLLNFLKDEDITNGNTYTVESMM